METTMYVDSFESTECSSIESHDRQLSLGSFAGEQLHLPGTSTSGKQWKSLELLQGNCKRTSSRELWQRNFGKGTSAKELLQTSRKELLQTLLQRNSCERTTANFLIEEPLSHSRSSPSVTEVGQRMRSNYSSICRLVTRKFSQVRCRFGQLSEV